MPSGLDGGASGGDVVQFASAPVEAELTGPAFTPDGKTLFLAVQHPGEETEDPKRADEHLARRRRAQVLGCRHNRLRLNAQQGTLPTLAPPAG
jgi:secreted PhoX family phosphatase